MPKFRIAACQFPVGSNIAENARWIRRYMRRAKKDGADIAHFPEGAISGYGGVDWVSLDGYQWQTLRSETETVMALAARLQLWVAVGSMHRLSGGNFPHNCVYLIAPNGTIADRYDKRFCMGREMEYYTPGNHSVTFELNGVKCALAICYDLRFPEIYRDLKRQGVECILQSFYNARQSGPSVHTDIMRQTMQAHAATNYFWVNMTNSSAYYSPYPSCFIQPDGKIVRQLRFNRPGLMVNEVDTDAEFYDASAEFRQMAMDGMLTNGPVRLEDPRTTDRTLL